MSKRKVLQMSLTTLGLFCLVVLLFNNPFRLSTQSTVLAERPEAEPLLATVPYRRLVTFEIPAGAGDAVGIIPDIPTGKKLTIEFAAIRAALPAADQRIKAGIESTGGTFVPFIMTDQGNYGGYQHFVASQPVNLIFQTGGIGKGVYAHRNKTSGKANISVYIVGQLEQ